MNTSLHIRLTTAMILLIFGAPVFAAMNPDTNHIENFSFQSDGVSSLLFAADTGKESQDELPPDSGPLVLPADEESDRDKKCMKVCEKWGEDCIINPKTGSRKCRKVCKLFGEECF